MDRRILLMRLFYAIMELAMMFVLFAMVLLDASVQAVVMVSTFYLVIATRGIIYGREFL